MCAQGPDFHDGLIAGNFRPYADLLLHATGRIAAGGEPLKGGAAVGSVPGAVDLAVVRDERLSGDFRR